MSIDWHYQGDGVQVSLTQVNGLIQVRQDTSLLKPDIEMDSKVVEI
jgi:hypothetical protein